MSAPSSASTGNNLLFATGLMGNPMATSSVTSTTNFQSEVIPSVITKNLGDRSYEKRKVAALELEHHIKELYNKSDEEGIRNIIMALRAEFAESAQPNRRKGALIGFAATAIALHDTNVPYLDAVLHPVITMLGDEDSRVRYYACESLYNLAKVARGAILSQFNEVFQGLCNLYADSDRDVRNGAQLLDRLIKDVVTESDQFDVENFIPLLRENIHLDNPFIRQLVVGWITVLDSVPDIDMLEFLPEFLEGLFDMLADSLKISSSNLVLLLKNFYGRSKKLSETLMTNSIARLQKMR